MNKPTPNVTPHEDIGPLDEHGQQIWSAEEEAAIARVCSGPQYEADIAEAEADIAAGRVHDHEEVAEHMRKVRRRYMAERGL